MIYYNGKPQAGQKVGGGDVYIASSEPDDKTALWVDTTTSLAKYYDATTSSWKTVGAEMPAVPTHTISTSDPSGGSDGDLWFKYTA